MSDMLSKTEVLQRPHWNKSLLKQLLGEPDNTRLRPNGTVHRYEYLRSRVESAEQSNAFAEKKEFDEIIRSDAQRRKAELREGLEYAAESDLQRLVVPKEGNFLEVYEYCQRQMKTYRAVLAGVAMVEERYVYGYHGEYASPDQEICRRIAISRPDLAFEAGIKYAGWVFQLIGVNTDKVIKTHLRMLENERESGEQIYMLPCHTSD